MARLATLLLLAAGLLACGLSAGLFFSFSILVMPGLDAADPASAIRAMQAINAAVRTPFFAFAFFGPLGLALLAAPAAWTAGLGRAALFALAGLLVYALGTFAVTMAVNVPLNERLAASAPEVAEAAALWRAYSEHWTAWNHLRTLAALLSCGLLAAAGLTALRPP